MSSNVNAGHPPASHGASFDRNNPYFQSDAFQGFDPSLSGEQDVSSGQHNWGYAPNRLDLAHPHAALDPQYQGWHGADQAHNYAPNHAVENHSPYFGVSYANESAPIYSTGYAHPNGYPTQQHPHHNQHQPELNHPTSPSTNAFTESHYVLPSSGFPQNAVQTSTVAPHVLQQEQRMPLETAKSSLSRQDVPSSTSSHGNNSAHFALPAGKAHGNFNIISPEEMESAASSRRLHNYVNVGNQAQDMSITKSALPAYIPRKSRNEITRLMASDSSLKSKVNKKLSKKATGEKKSSIRSRSSAPSLAKPGGSKAQSTEASSDEGSDDESESDSSDEEEESMKPPLPDVRPKGAVEAVKYDTTKTLWRVPYRSATSDDIRKGLADFWEVIKTIRDRWKSDASAVKQAVEAKKVNEIPFLKERVADQREMLVAALETAVTHGHKDIVEHLGEHLAFMAAIAVFLQDRARDTDYNGALSKAILELISRCKTLTDGNLEKTGVSKILERFVKRGDDKVKALSKKVFENATAASKKKKDAIKTGTSSTTQPKEAKGSPSGGQIVGSPVAGSKRQRDSEGSNVASQPSKKIASEGPGGAGSPPSKKIGPDKPAMSNGESKPAAATVASTAQKKVVAKPSGFFSSLQPAYKKSTTPTSSTGISQTKTSMQTGTSDKKSFGSAATVAPSKPAFSFAETMANLTKPKESEPTPKEEETAPVETSEEKAKRLRKEERRKLRVSFKPEGSLVDIRYFVHDPEEELGHEASQVRDVGDLESEGRMFKLQHKEDLERMDLDDEEDEDDSHNEVTTPYNSPSLIDFSDVPEADKERNYYPYGGGTQAPETPEREVQERREATTLIVVYSQESDIPTSPKEPTEGNEDGESPTQFGTAPDHIQSRIDSSARGPKPASSGLSTTDLSALLGSLSQQSRQPQQQTPQPASAPMTELEKLFAQFSNQNAQNATASQHQTFPNHQYQNPQTTFSSSTSQPPSSGNPAVPDPSALLASLQSAGHLASLQQNSNSGTDLYGQWGRDGQQTFDYDERRRWHENSSGDQEDHGKKQNHYHHQKQWGNKKGSRDPNKPTPKFVVQCKYFKEGKCVKGANCTFLHDAD